MQAPITFTYNYLEIYQEPRFQIALLIIFILYCYFVILLHRGEDNFSTLFRYNSHDDSMAAYSHSQRELSTRIITLFVMIQVIWSALFSLISLRLLSEHGLSGAILETMNLTPRLLAVVLFSVPMVMWLYQWLIVLVVGVVNQHTQMTSSLVRLQFACGAMGASLMIPILFLLLASDIVDHVTMSYIVLFLLALIFLNDIFHTFGLFIKEKFPILDWFLYLCTVKIIPLTFIWRVLTIHSIN
ncbi:MAG: DUF4271 domain-containing protein [Rikenellaceae bacterium]